MPLGPVPPEPVPFPDEPPEGPPLEGPALDGPALEPGPSVATEDGNGPSVSSDEGGASVDAGALEAGALETGPSVLPGGKGPSVSAELGDSEELTEDCESLPPEGGVWLVAQTGKYRKYRTGSWPLIAPPPRRGPPARAGRCTSPRW